MLLCPVLVSLRDWLRYRWQTRGERDAWWFLERRLDDGTVDFVFKTQKLDEIQRVLYGFTSDWLHVGARPYWEFPADGGELVHPRGISVWRGHDYSPPEARTQPRFSRRF